MQKGPRREVMRTRSPPCLLRLCQRLRTNTLLFKARILQVLPSRKQIYPQSSNKSSIANNSQRPRALITLRNCGQAWRRFIVYLVMFPNSRTLYGFYWWSKICTLRVSENHWTHDSKTGLQKAAANHFTNCFLVGPQWDGGDSHTFRILTGEVSQKCNKWVPR